MDEQYTISTPEQVSFYYETAGIGSRSLGALLDSMIIVTTKTAIILLIAFLQL